VWALGITYSFWRRDDYATTRDLMLVVGVLFVALPIANAIATSGGLIAIGAPGELVSAFVDIGFIAIGAATLVMSRTLPKRRTTKADKASEPPALSERMTIAAE
ncbi:MAG: hypothetical protein AAGJ87_11265, partial [Pseudomonadota bacterium]